MAAFTELDLTTACYPKSISPWLNIVPGLRTSTAFFTFLRANLVLAPSVYCQAPPTKSLPPPSYINTTLKDARTHAHRRRRSRNSNPPSSSNIPRMNTMSDTTTPPPPPLTVEVLTEKADKAAALRLIADSVSQQRAAASLHLVFHPACLAVLFAALAAAYYHASRYDNGMLLSLLGGVVMCYLTLIRFATADYLTWAESLGWNWLRRTPGGEDDTVIATRYGGNVIGALVLRVEPGSPNASGNTPLTASQKRRARKDSSGSNSGAEAPKFKGGKGVIRAWTTQMRYRGNGVGKQLLQEAVRLTRERCGKDAEVGFALEHVHSKKVLPEFFMKPVRGVERKAARALEGIVGEKKVVGKKMRKEG